ncbi:MAG: peptidoglycan DD-metalloendopeptidase family protein [Clostridiales bacterium]
MSSINDYHRYEPERLKNLKRYRLLPRGRVVKQMVVSLVFFFLVAIGVGAQNWLGEGARYVAGPGLSAENSWLDFSDALPVLGGNSADPVIPDAAVAAAGADSIRNGAAGSGSAGNDSAAAGEIRFIAPASGVVVKDIALDSSGVTAEKGIVIQGAAGQDIMAAAAGEVIYLGDCDSGYIVQLSHGGGYVSAYQGISQLVVKAGDQVAAGDVLGDSSSGELLFSLTRDGTEVDPLDYLFAETP